MRRYVCNKFCNNIGRPVPDAASLTCQTWSDLGAIKTIIETILLVFQISAVSVSRAIFLDTRDKKICLQQRITKSHRTTTHK